MKIKYIALITMSLIGIHTLSARSITITNPSKHDIMLLPLWEGQGKYDILLSPIDSVTKKYAKKTYELGNNTIRRVYWIELNSAGFKNKGQKVAQLEPRAMIKYYADINMVPKGEPVLFSIYNNGMYSYDGRPYTQATSTELGYAEMQDLFG